MKILRQVSLRGLACMALLCASPLAMADYFVRPYVQLGAVVQDGLVQNGATQNAVNIGSQARAEANLATGQVRNFLEVAGPGTFGQSASVMGDRLTFSGAQGTTLGFGFDFDGVITSDLAAIPNQTLQVGVIANLRVFDANAGATFANFAGLGGALVSDTRFLQFNNPTAPLDELVQEALFGSLLVGATGPLTLDVFASLSIFVATNANPVTVTMDFLNTGTIGVDTAPGVSYTSLSGVFPGSVTEPSASVPEPGSHALMLAGLAGMGFVARRRRRA